MAIRKRGEKLKIYFHHTQNSGVGMWRMIHPADVINRLGLAEVRTPPFYWRTHSSLDWGKYVVNCQKLNKEPTPEEYQSLLKKYPKDWSVENIEKMCNWADVIVVMRQDSRQHCALLQAIGDLKKPLILETDDFVHYVPPYNPGARFYAPGSEQSEIWSSKQFGLVDHVQVTTPGLKDLYVQLNKKITIIPNCIDPNYWLGHPDPEPHKEIRLGWWGANAHWGDLRILKNVIHKILDKYPQVVFHFMGQVPDWWYDLRKNKRMVEHKFSNLKNYPKKIHSFDYDIGVAPLVDNLFNRGKSNIRWVEYSLNKIATVASPVWAYKKDPYGVMKEGKNVMYAKEPGEWVNKLSTLIENESLRKTMANQAYKDTLQYYNLEARAKEFVDFYQDQFDNFTRN